LPHTAAVLFRSFFGSFLSVFTFYLLLLLLPFPTILLFYLHSFVPFLLPAHFLFAVCRGKRQRARAPFSASSFFLFGISVLYGVRWHLSTAPFIWALWFGLLSIGGPLVDPLMDVVYTRTLGVCVSGSRMSRLAVRGRFVSLAAASGLPFTLVLPYPRSVLTHLLHVTARQFPARGTAQTHLTCCLFINNGVGCLFFSRRLVLAFSDLSFGLSSPAEFPYILRAWIPCYFYTFRGFPTTNLSVQLRLPARLRVICGEGRRGGLRRSTWHGERAVGSQSVSASEMTADNALLK